MADLLTTEELHAEYQAMDACKACRLFRAAHNALLDLSPDDEGSPQYLSTSEWCDAQRPVSVGQKRHWADAHPRYDAHIKALSAERKAKEAAGV